MRVIVQAIVTRIIQVITLDIIQIIIVITGLVLTAQRIDHLTIIVPVIHMAINIERIITRKSITTRNITIKIRRRKKLISKINIQRRNTTNQSIEISIFDIIEAKATIETKAIIKTKATINIAEINMTEGDLNDKNV